MRGYKNPGSPFSFHGFPKNENQKLMWENVAHKKNTISSVVCGAHFKCDYFTPGYTRKMLRADAVPSIFPKFVPCEKRVHVLSNVTLGEGAAPKTIKLQDNSKKSAILKFRSSKRSILEGNNTTEETDNSDILMRLVDRTDLSDYKNNKFYYILGYVVMKILDKLTCPHCRASLVTHRTHRDYDYLIDVCDFSSFTVFVDRGGLKYASSFVFNVVKYIEKFF